MILTALNNYYDRLVENDKGDVPPFGFSSEKISCCIVIDTNGQMVDVYPLGTGGTNKSISLIVPKNEGRSGSKIFPFFLWDKTSYVLGLTGKPGSERDRAIETFNAFKMFHKENISSCDDEGLQALVKFLDGWNPNDQELTKDFPPNFLDKNVVFKLDGENKYLHQRKASIDIYGNLISKSENHRVQCLVTGRKQAPARLHPKIKNVDDAQPAGANLVSFKQDSFQSYGKFQGDNAPVSEKAVFAYGSALNYLLRRESSNKQRLKIGDATVVFWAESSSSEETELAESFLSFGLAPKSEADSDDEQTQVLLDDLVKVAKGRPVTELGLALNPETRIYILGLAPNNARLSVRFWHVDTLEHFARCLSEHYQDLYLEPQRWKQPPAIWRLLSETVPHREGSKPKLDDVAPQLAGELTRAILTGRRYPRSLLTNLIMRMRADGDLSPLRIALCKAVLVREARLNSQHNKEIPVSLDTDNDNPGYLLGRLFSTLESVQIDALDGAVNASIKDRFYGAASATPATIFPMLLRNAQNHFGKLRKSKPGLAVSLEKQITEVIGRLPAEFPKTLGLEEQGRFAIGYYHQRSEKFKKRETEIEEGDSE